MGAVAAMFAHGPQDGATNVSERQAQQSHCDRCYDEGCRIQQHGQRCESDDGGDGQGQLEIKNTRREAAELFAIVLQAVEDTLLVTEIHRQYEQAYARITLGENTEFRRTHREGDNQEDYCIAEQGAGQADYAPQ